MPDGAGRALFGMSRARGFRFQLPYLFKAHVEYRVLTPVLVVVVPPLGRVGREAFGLHRGAQQVAEASLLGLAARVVDVRALRHLVVLAGHRDLPAGLEVVEREVNRAAAVVARALRGVGDELLLVGGRDLPEEFGDRPRAVAVEDGEAVALLPERARRTDERLGGRALEEGARLCVDGATREVVRRRVAHVELYRTVELHQLDEVGRAERALLLWRIVLGK